MRITVNLATRPFADLGPAIKRLRIIIAVMALASIGLGLGLYFLHHKAEEARASAHSLDGQVAAITRERQSYQDLMRQPANAQLLVEVGALNQLFDKKTFSWTLAMEDLETVLPGGVQVSTLEPIVDEKTGAISLRLRVIGPRDRAVELVQNLEHSRRFVLPRIVGENAESTGGPNERLEPVSASNRFNLDLLAQYNPASADELKRARGSQKPAASPAAATAPPASPAARPAPALKPKAGLATQVKPQQQPVQAVPPRGPNALGPPQWRGSGSQGQPGRPPLPHRQPNQGGPQ
jgi:type IV pilus assembly protein PilN